MNELRLLPEKVISGGQTGADQAGLIAAREFGIATGGWMPQGHQTSTGPNPELAREFGLKEHHGGYAERTETNVRASDGTLRIAGTFNTLGEKCTLKWIRHHGKPSLDVAMNAPIAVEDVVEWINRHEICVLNVAGNREPKSRTALASGITDFAVDFLRQLFGALGYEKQA